MKTMPIASMLFLFLAGCATIEHPPRRSLILVSSIIAAGLAAAASEQDDTFTPPPQRPDYKGPGQPVRCCPLTPVD